MRCGNQTDEFSPSFTLVMGLMDSLRAAYASHDLKERFIHHLLLRGPERAGPPVIVKIWIVKKRGMTLFVNHDEMQGPTGKYATDPRDRRPVALPCRHG